MPLCKIALDQATYEQLVEIAFRELRPPAMQAEWLLRRAIWQASAAEVPAPQPPGDAEDTAKESA